MARKVFSKVRLLILFNILLVAFFLCGGLQICFAGENKVDVNSIIQETQQKSDRAGEMTFVWWIPEEYWQASFAQNPNMTTAQAEEFIKVFRPYTLIAIVDGKVSTYGAVNYKTEDEIKNSVRLKDSQGNEYPSLTDAEVNPDAKNLLLMMKPVLANILGPMGQNMYFFIFPSKNKDSQAISDAKKEGAFSISLGDREFRWKLPLSSLLPPKTCPTCKEKLSGTYKFCPWDGTKLSE